MKRILIIGAGFLQDFVICKARELGYYTLAIDGSPEAIGLKHADQSTVIDITDCEACLDYAKKHSVDGVMTAATDYGVLSASYVSEQLKLPGISYETAKLIKDKFEVCRRLKKLTKNDTYQAFEVMPDTDVSSLDIHYPVIVKPCDGSGSRATTKVDRPDKLHNAIRLALNTSRIKRALIESFFCGNEYGAESLVVNGKVYVLGIMKKWMTEPPFYAELGHQIPSDLPIETEQFAIHYVKNAIKELGINHGAVNMDLIIRENGDVHIVDVGARMGGNMIGTCIIPIGTGIHYLENLIRITVGDKPNWNRDKSERVATRLLAFNKGVIKKLPDFDALEEYYDVKIYHHLKELEQVNEYHTNLDGYGYIVAKGENASEIAERVLVEIRKSVI